MGKLKDNALNNDKDNEDTAVHALLPSEAELIRSLNVALKFHTLGAQIISHFLFLVATYRLGYPSNSNLSFAFDWDNPENNDLTITIVPPLPAPEA